MKQSVKLRVLHSHASDGLSDLTLREETTQTDGEVCDFTESDNFFFFFPVNQDYQILTDYFSLSDRPSLSTPSIGSVRPGPCCPIALLLIFCVTASVWTSHR